MPPKKAKKIPLNEFLGNDALGSWADEMDSLPSAPAARNDDDPGDRYGRRDDFLSSRPDRLGPPRDDVPMPTQPPYTAFIGNLAFDLTESELEEFFGPSKTKSVKIIKDREDKPKGFGYIEFEELDGLKDALAKSGSNFSGRTVRVSVAEPPKERSGFGGGNGFDDEAKFDNPWRRDGPLPDIGQSRDSSRRRFDGPPSTERVLPSVAEGASDWRSSRAARPSVPDEPPVRRRSGFSTPEGQASAADQAEVWTKGSKFVPSANPSEEKFGSMRGRGDMGPPRDTALDEGDWRSARPKSNISPDSSTPPTPQMGRRKLELLPRSGSASVTQTPLSSPKMSSTPAAVSTSARASPFGAARPVDVTNKDKEVEERLDKEREVAKLTISRTNSRQASERSPLTGARTPPTTGSTGSGSPKVASATTPAHPKPALAPSVRPTLSFASAAAAKRDAASAIAAASNEKAEPQDEKRAKAEADDVEKVVEKVAEVAI
ncbi:hypothetical protein D9615_004186 [Tricholomella constricta]|uniref:RRM domain-containing protein n=1 Tax=Tricholomella constricta TaxID=117010 RepID=A0A8H5M617_9AGAR|nr:hypothetical protein D9615_004186 [Tricholomella constricta]